jgi:TPR repeat protein
MNDKKEAVAWLEKAAKTGFPNYPLFLSDPNLINLKGYQKYDELLIELKEKWDFYKTL